MAMSSYVGQKGPTWILLRKQFVRVLWRQSDTAKLQTFSIPQAIWRKKRIFLQKTLHLRIRRMNQSSSGQNPQKVLPSPPKSHGSVTSIGLFGSRSYWPLPIIIRSRRRNLRLQNCFPRFCDLQQQQVLAGVFFLLLLIMSRMSRVAAMPFRATQLNITRL